MLHQIIIGSFLIVLSIVIEITFIEIGILALRKTGKNFVAKASTIKLIIVMSAVTLWLLAALSLAIWIWAIAFVLLSALPSIEQGLYFSMVSFTTLGFGDLTLPDEWRLLSGFVAANGLMLFGLNTAFLIQVLARFRGALEQQNNQMGNKTAQIKK